MRQQLPQYSLVRLDDGGHHVHMARPTHVADTIRAFELSNAL
jgi:pimeloyl-ACP methyl ester carboxylesterase